MHRTIGPTALMLVLAAIGAARQMLEEDTVPSPPARKLDIGQLCGEAIRRFCPAETDAPSQRRNAAICLRPYRTSLSLSCRAAVDAQLH